MIRTVQYVAWGLAGVGVYHAVSNLAGAPMWAGLLASAILGAVVGIVDGMRE